MGKKKKQPEPVKAKEIVVKSEHKLVLDDKVVSYRATAGTLLLKEEDGTAKASIYYTAYTKQGVKDAAKQPITFAFNGGPGSSSVWLHLGVLGPRRVLLEEDGQPLPPPGKLVDNAYSLLDQTDLVFIDPVSTGYSRAVPGGKTGPLSQVRGRHCLGGAVHPAVHHAAQAVGQPQALGGRELWHHARCRPERLFAVRVRHVSQRYRARLGGAPVSEHQL